MDHLNTCTMVGELKVEKKVASNIGRLRDNIWSLDTVARVYCSVVLKWTAYL